MSSTRVTPDRQFSGVSHDRFGFWEEQTGSSELRGEAEALRRDMTHGWQRKADRERSEGWGLPLKEGSCLSASGLPLIPPGMARSAMTKLSIRARLG